MNLFHTKKTKFLAIVLFIFHIISCVTALVDSESTDFDIAFQNLQLILKNNAFVKPHRGEIEKALENVPQKHKKTYYNFLSSFIPYMTSYKNTLDTIKKTLKMNPLERQEYHQSMLPILQQINNPYMGYDIIKQTLTIEPQNRHSIFRSAQPLLLNIDNDFSKSTIMTYIIKMPLEKREAFYKFVEPLMLHVHNTENTIMILEHVLLSASLQQIKEIPSLMAVLNITDSSFIKTSIILTGLMMPIETRKGFSDFLFLLLQNINDEHKMQLTELSLKTPIKKRNQIIQFKENLAPLDAQQLINALKRLNEGESLTENHEPIEEVIGEVNKPEECHCPINNPPKKRSWFSSCCVC